jgi:predicted DNA-binding transcriptional regulator YafY
LFKKHDYDKTLTRLTGILTRLYYGEVLGVGELAEEFGVSTRTIQRDLHERLSGFPVEKAGQKWRMKKNHTLLGTLEAEEAITLEILRQLSRSVGQGFYSRANRILKKLLTSEGSPFYVRGGVEEISDRLADVQTIEGAIRGQQVIGFTYTSAKGTKPVIVWPLKIISFEGYWYLMAYEPASGIYKKYYLPGMTELALSGEAFTLPPDVTDRMEKAINIWFRPEIEPYEVRLLVTGGAAKYLQRRAFAPTQKILARHGDGSVEISCHVTHDMEILPVIRYWHPEVLVIGPEDLKARVVEDAKRFLEKMDALGGTHCY